MKTLRCHQFGPPESLQLDEVPSPVPGSDELLIRVHACGVNFPDTLIIQGKYQFKPELPFAPGGDIAGVVIGKGEEVKGWEIGQEVVAMTAWGGFSEEIAVPVSLCVPKPTSMSFINAAAFSMVYGTSYYALKDRGQLKEGENLVVLGASGGVGLAAVELGKLMGARVIAAASTEEKLALCREYGADATINYQEEDLKKRIRELTEGKGADVIYDPVGGAYSEPAFRSTAWGGRFLVVGFAAGDIPAIPLNLPLLKGSSIVGVFWGAFARKEVRANMANMMQLVQWFDADQLKPHIQATYPLAEGGQAIRDIADRKAMGKIVVVMGESG